MITLPTVYRSRKIRKKNKESILLAIIQSMSRERAYGREQLGLYRITVFSLIVFYHLPLLDNEYDNSGSIRPLKASGREWFHF